PLPSSPCPRLYAPPTFPTRRSSDLDLRQRAGERIVDIDIDDRSSAVLGFMQRVDDISLGARGMALVDAAAGDLAGIAVLIGLDVDVAAEIRLDRPKLDRHAALGLGGRSLLGQRCAGNALHDIRQVLEPSPDQRPRMVDGEALLEL